MAELLGFPVVEINAKNKDGFDELLSTVKKVANKHIDTTQKLVYGPELREHLGDLQALIEKDVNLTDVPAMWTAIKLLEKDAIVIEKEDAVIIELKVGPSDMGKVIGRQGRIAKAIRTVVKAASSKSSKKVIVDILQ